MHAGSASWGGHSAAAHQFWVSPDCAAPWGSVGGMHRAARAGRDQVILHPYTGAVRVPMPQPRLCNQHHQAKSGALCFRLAPGPTPRLPIVLMLASPSFLWTSPCSCTRATTCACPHPAKSPGVPLCWLPLSMRHFTQQEQHHLFFLGVLRPPAWAFRGRGCPAHPSWELRVQAAAQGTSAATALLPACTRDRQGSASTMAGSRQHPAGRDLATGAAGLGHMLPFTSTGRARVSKLLAASTLGCINNQPADGEGFTSCFS